MFTGLISLVSKVSSVETQGETKRLRVTHRIDDLTMGESIALNGVCLTVSSFTDSVLTFDVGPQTLALSTLGSLIQGSTVHLERALLASDRLGGHFVSGHVDDVATLISVDPIVGGGGWLEFSLRNQASFARYVVPQGSICLDGISLTVAEKRADSIRVMVIPHTWSETALGAYPVGQRLNVEYDMLAKFVWEQRKSLPILE